MMEGEERDKDSRGTLGAGLLVRGSSAPDVDRKGMINGMLKQGRRRGKHTNEGQASMHPATHNARAIKRAIQQAPHARQRPRCLDAAALAKTYPLDDIRSPGATQAPRTSTGTSGAQYPTLRERAHKYGPGVPDQQDCTIEICICIFCILSAFVPFSLTSTQLMCVSR